MSQAWAAGQPTGLFGRSSGRADRELRIGERREAEPAVDQTRWSGLREGQLSAPQDRLARLRTAIARLVGPHAGGRVAVLIADGEERLGSVFDVDARELVLNDLYGQSCAIPLEKILSVQLLPPLRRRATISRRVNAGK